MVIGTIDSREGACPACQSGVQVFVSRHDEEKAGIIFLTCIVACTNTDCRRQLGFGSKVIVGKEGAMGIRSIRQSPITGADFSKYFSQHV